MNEGHTSGSRPRHEVNDEEQIGGPITLDQNLTYKTEVDNRKSFKKDYKRDMEFHGYRV